MVDYLSQAPAFDIEELSGSRRRVTLRGRALPYQNVAYTGKQRNKLTWYPGNPVASLQVLGPELEPTRLQGMWKDRFLVGQVEVRGFEKPGTAEQLVAIFDSLRRSGNQLRVQWGAETRFGILALFEANWVRPQDVKWEAEFVWTGDQETAPRAGGVAQTNEALRKALTATDDDFVMDPGTMKEEYRGDIVAGIDAMREKAGLVFDGVRQVQQSPDGAPITAVQGAVAAVEALRSEGEATIGVLVDVPYTVGQTFDSVIEVLEGEVWRRTTSLRVRQQRAAAQRQGRVLVKAAVPGAIAIVVVPADTTLRQLAITYYGSADDWQIIADVNGLHSSLVSAGTTLIITPKPSAARAGV